jgi:hypothetical protein
MTEKIEASFCDEQVVGSATHTRPTSVMSATLDTSFLPSAASAMADAATALAAEAADVLYALSGVELTPDMYEALRALESSVECAMAAVREASETYTEYVAEVAEVAAAEQEAEDEENDSMNSEIDYAFDYYEMLD